MSRPVETDGEAPTSSRPARSSASARWSSRCSRRFATPSWTTRRASSSGASTTTRSHSSARRCHPSSVTSSPICRSTSRDEACADRRRAPHGQGPARRMARRVVPRHPGHVDGPADVRPPAARGHAGRDPGARRAPASPAAPATSEKPCSHSRNIAVIRVRWSSPMITAGPRTHLESWVRLFTSPRHLAGSSSWRSSSAIVMSMLLPLRDPWPDRRRSGASKRVSDDGGTRCARAHLRGGSRVRRREAGGADGLTQDGCRCPPGDPGHGGTAGHRPAPLVCVRGPGPRVRPHVRWTGLSRPAGRRFHP